MSTREGGPELVEVPVDRIEPDPEQPRAQYDPKALDRLAQSLTVYGQIQPITVRPAARAGCFVIVTGERRWRSAVIAGRLTVTALVVDGPTADFRRLELQLVENALREDLSPLDQARAYQTLMDRNEWTTRQVAEALHLHFGTVSRAVRLLRLPDALREEVESDRLAPSIASEIARLDDPGAQRALAARAIAEGLSRVEVMRIVRLGSIPDHPDASTSRLFRTSAGRVTIELDRASGLFAVIDAVTEVAKVLHAELHALNQAGNRP